MSRSSIKVKVTGAKRSDTFLDGRFRLKGSLVMPREVFCIRFCPSVSEWVSMRLKFLWILYLKNQCIWVRRCAGQLLGSKDQRPTSQQCRQWLEKIGWIQCLRKITIGANFTKIRSTYTWPWKILIRSKGQKSRSQQAEALSMEVRQVLSNY